jgi:hypothetical protein
MKKIAIVQSNYIPWKGYFDMIAAVDEFILYDDVQFTKNDWRNRNKIKTPKGLEWITIPVGQGIKRRIRDVELPDHRWQQKHWKTLTSNYHKAPCFDEIAEVFEPLYLHRHFDTLSQLNRTFIQAVCAYLDIATKISNSWDYEFMEGRVHRLVHICSQAGATEYVSGSAAKDYLSEGLFSVEGIKLTWFDYAGYPEYPQLWGGFDHSVTILDLLFNCGKDAPRYMRHVGK